MLFINQYAIGNLNKKSQEGGCVVVKPTSLGTATGIPESAYSIGKQRTEISLTFLTEHFEFVQGMLRTLAQNRTPALIYDSRAAVYNNQTYMTAWVESFDGSCDYQDIGTLTLKCVPLDGTTSKGYGNLAPHDGLTPGNILLNAPFIPKELPLHFPDGTFRINNVTIGGIKSKDYSGGNSITANVMPYATTQPDPYTNANTPTEVQLQLITTAYNTSVKRLDELITANKVFYIKDSYSPFFAGQNGGWFVIETYQAQNNDLSDYGTITLNLVYATNHDGASYVPELLPSSSLLPNAETYPERAAKFNIGEPDTGNTDIEFDNVPATGFSFDGSNGTFQYADINFDSGAGWELQSWMSIINSSVLLRCDPNNPGTYAGMSCTLNNNYFNSNASYKVVMRIKEEGGTLPSNDLIVKVYSDSGWSISTVYPKASLDLCTDWTTITMNLSSNYVPLKATDVVTFEVGTSSGMGIYIDWLVMYDVNTRDPRTVAERMYFVSGNSLITFDIDRNMVYGKCNFAEQLNGFIPKICINPMATKIYSGHTQINVFNILDQIREATVQYSSDNTELLTNVVYGAANDLYTAITNKNIYVYDFTNSLLGTKKGTTDTLNDAIYTPANNKIYATSSSNKIYVMDPYNNSSYINWYNNQYNPSNGTTEGYITLAADNTHYTMGIAKYGNLVFVSCSDANIYQINTVTNAVTLFATLQSPAPLTVSIATELGVSPDGVNLICYDGANTVQIFNINTKQLVKLIMV